MGAAMTESIAPLRARVRLQSPARAEDSLGGAALSWNDEGWVWAEISASAPSSSASYDAAPSVAPLTLTIRRRDVRAGWRVLWRARVLLVLGVRDKGASRIDLTCEEEVR